jgi:rod shape-determining protein MreD
MPVSPERPGEVFKVRWITLALSVFGALLLQAVLPLMLPMARLVDLPLLVTIYFALVRRDKIFGIGMGTVLGLIQDALSHGYIGIFGMAKALIGYLAAAASRLFELESILLRTIMTAGLVLLHSLCLTGLQHALLNSPSPIQPLEMASGVLVNVALALVLFQLLDRIGKPA